MVNIIERADLEAKLVALDAHKEQYTTAAQASAENIYGHTNSTSARTAIYTATKPTNVSAISAAVFQPISGSGSLWSAATCIPRDAIITIIISQAKMPGLFCLC